MELSGQNTTEGFNQSAFVNDTDNFKPNTDMAFTNISFGLGCLTTVINVITLVFLLRHEKCVGGTGFWQQLLFLCFTDILSGIAVMTFPLGYFFIKVHSDIYYSLCVTGIFLFPISLTLSAGNCCMISIQRYIFVRLIDKPVTIWHKHATSLMILSNIFLCIVTVVSSVAVVTIRFGFHYKEFCNMVNMSGQNEYKSKYILGSVMILVLFLLATNISTVLSIMKIKDKSRIHPARASSPMPSVSTLQPSNIQTVVQRNRYATNTFIVIVFVLNLTTIPSLLFLIVSINTEVNVSAEITEIISRMMSINSVINPFIYSMRTISLRKAVWKDIKAVWARFKCASGTL